MQTTTSPDTFKLSSGGLVHWLLLRTRIQKPDKYNVQRRIILLCTLTWVPLFVLSAFEGNLLNPDLTVSFIHDLKPYIRYLVALPLLVVADTIIDPLIAMVIRNINSSGIIPDDGKTDFNQAFTRLDRRNDSFIADVVIISITVLISWGYVANLDRLDVYTAQSSWASILQGDKYDITAAGWWFLIVSSPLLQIMLFRWLWRFIIWCEFLFRVSRIKLVLEPTHPDLAGGLGVLKNSQNAFIILFIAFGTMLSVSLAEDIIHAGDTVIQSGPTVISFVVSSLVITTLPLFFFSKQLIITKILGRSVYGALGYKLSRAFDEKWGKAMDAKTGKNLLEVTDSSSVCDYSDIFDVVRSMRFIPINWREYIIQAVILSAPFAPLVFLEMPVNEVMKRIFTSLI